MLTVSEALAEAAERESELAPYYELHRALLELQEKAREEITATLEMVDEEALRARTLQGLPLLSFDQLPIAADHFVRLARGIAEVLAAHEVEVRDDSLPGTDQEWVSLAQRRFEAGQVTKEEEQDKKQQEVELTLAQITTDQALKPYLAWAAEHTLPFVDQDRWKRGYCPVCGGAPDFAALEADAGARNLLCSRCNSQWIYQRVGCPFCGITDHTQLMYYPSEDEVYRLYVCQACQRYLKTIDLRKATQKALLTVERIATVAMDAAAQQEGYR